MKSVTTQFNRNHLILAGMLALLAALVLLPDLSLAAQNAGDMAEHLQGQVVAWGKLGKVAAVVIGIFLAVGGIIVFAGMKKNQTPAIIPVMMLVCGLALVFFSQMIEMGGATAFENVSTDSAYSDVMGN